MTNHLYDGLFGAHASRKTLFVETPEGGRWSYTDAAAAIDTLARALLAQGVAPGDRVAAQIDKSPHAVFLYLAVVKIGAVFLPLNRSYTPAEIGYFLGDAEPTLFICDPALRDGVAAALTGSPPLIHTFDAGGKGSLAAVTDGAGGRIPACDRAESDLSALLYTSGTTGRAKGAMLTHGNLLSNAQALMQYWRITERDVLIHALPVYHTHGLFVAINTVLLAGGSMIFMAKFDADAIIAALPRATLLMGVPTFYTRLLARPQLDRQACSTMRLFVSGSAPLLAETHAQWLGRTGHAILERYGMTETNMNTSNPYDGDRIAGTVGFPLPGVELRIVEAETGRPLGANQIGSIEVRGPNVCAGYWRKPEATKASFRSDGFFITGDVGVTDDRGYVSIVGREKDMIISGGLNVYPSEIEGEINAVPGVVESAVIGVSDPDLGEAVTAVVVRAAGQSVDAQTLMRLLKTRLAGYKLPKKVEFVDELPRNVMGKVQKNLLRDRYR
jgi:malonyl-CoA/methylmalonyl-CoA synthetase